LVVPILKNGESWGDIEIKYTPLRGESGLDFYQQSIFKMGSFVLIVGFFVNLVFMLRTLRILDPTAVIPGRVTAAFDTLTEGIIILDEHEQIVLVNKAMTEKLVQPMSALLGKKLSTLQWEGAKDESPDYYFPWQRVLSTGKSSIGAQLTLISSDFHAFKFVINASPIQSANGMTQGVLITLDDITELEERNIALQKTVSRLEEAQSQVEQQNKELNFLVTKDPLTGCLNRRSFNEQFEIVFKQAQQNKSELSCFMADIDHFKAVNDNYGHAKGDVVIKLFAEVLQANTRKVDLVGRYGGEEFCIVIPDLSAEEVALVAERIRLRLKDESENRFETGPHVTASFGVSSLKDNPLNPLELQNLADEALYVAKQSGRNQVIRWQPGSEHVSHVETKTDLVNEVKQDGKSEDTSATSSITKLQQRVNELESIASQFSAELEYKEL
jgi:diguanylate cyclase (GGDEF)-like protein/PAS domain S-box-containing protein